MNIPAIVFLLLSSAGVFFFRREFAPIPLLASCCYMTTGQKIELGPISLPVYRIVLAVGLLRLLVRHETITGNLNNIDKLIVLWAAWVMFASFFHEWAPGAGPVFASGFVFNVSLVYFLIRVWCGELSELTNVLRVVAWLLVPISFAMIAEHMFARNVFGMFGGDVTESVYVRAGKIRAQGPFAHPILAGTVGAVCFPMMAGLWYRYRTSSIVGAIACLVIVLASTSSGPLMSLFMGGFGLLFWLYRPALRLIRWAAIVAYLSADLVMTRPAYYLISKIDLTGSSTGYHRSRLIESAFEHFSEWWAFGTDYTAHWMPYALDGKHCDITNYYLLIGIIGGFPAMVLLIAIMRRAFLWVGESVRTTHAMSQEHQFTIWCLGAGLFAHAVTSMSVAYFDQSMMFFWLNVGVISSVYSITSRADVPITLEPKVRTFVTSRPMAPTRTPH